MTEEIVEIDKKPFDLGLDPDKLAIGVLTAVAGWFVSAAVSKSYSKLVIEPREFRNESK